MIGQKMLMIGAAALADCGVIGSMIDEYEWLPGNSTGWVNVVHIAGTVYAFVHGYDIGGSSGMRISTINIATNGDITSGLIAAVNVSSIGSNGQSSTLKVSQDGHGSGDCVIAIFNKRKASDEGGTNDCICRTWRISQAGAINGEIDSLEMGSGNVSGTYSPNGLVRIGAASSIFATVAFTGANIAYMFTFSISSGGVFGSVLDSVVIDSTFNVPSRMQIVKVGSLFIVNYRKAYLENKNVFKSYTIGGAGAITYKSSKDMELNTSEPVIMLDMTDIGFDGFACSYCTNASPRNKVVSYGVSATGVFTNPVDSIYVDLGNANGIHISSLTGNGIIAHWKNSGNGGYLSTLTMDNSGNFTGLIDTIYTNRTLYEGDYPFLIEGSSNPTIYGISFEGNNSDGYAQTYDITNICT